jgi:hypothetical protein
VGDFFADAQKRYIYTPLMSAGHSLDRRDMLKVFTGPLAILKGVERQYSSDRVFSLPCVALVVASNNNRHRTCIYGFSKCSQIRSTHSQFL